MELNLLQGPHVVLSGERSPVPRGAERLVVLVALSGPVRRVEAARRLWPEADTGRAAGNLRSALWRLHGAGLDVVAERDGWLRLSEQVTVDVRALGSRAAALAEGGGGAADLALLPVLADALNLLPGCYDDWVTDERDRLRALALDALDGLSVRLGLVGAWADAIDAALLAVTTDPLRETSQSALIRAHLAEGNLVEARRAFDAYRTLLETDIGLEPPTGLTALVAAGAA